MKKLFVLGLLSIGLISCGNKKEDTTESLYPDREISPEEKLISDGKKLFNSNKAACYSCHHMDKKVIGPSIIEIAEIYKEQNGDMIAFLRKQAEPIVDPSQYNVMETNFAILKTMSDEELRSLEAYMMSMAE